MKKILVMLIVTAAIGGGGAAWYWQTQAAGLTAYRTVAVERGELEATVSATGTLQPEEVIDVGAQVAGRIEKFGKDLRDSTKSIDYASEVEEGTILAQLDPSLFKSRRDAAKADLEKTKADLKQQEAKAYQAQRDMSRARDLLTSKALAPADYDVAQATFETAQANVAVTQATIAQAQAALEEAETNLKYTVVRSPVKGVIIERRVNIGQTVVASLQAPSLFLLAKDLSKIIVLAQVNEADIGQIKIGQTVRFAVDALPGRVFQGEVIPQGKYSTRLNAQMTNNVVTYTVVVRTDNSTGDLLPYLTANVQFVVSQKTDALLVPNAALRWLPKANQVTPEARAAFASNQRRKRTDSDKEAADKKRSDQSTVWVVDGDFVRPVRVRIGLGDGSRTEILEGELEEGMALVVGERQRDNGSEAANPFTPQMFGGKKTQ